MPTSNRVKGRIGINTVAAIVENLWECGWQEYGASNDDAIDGVILMRKGKVKPADTGGIVFVQVKCGGDGYRQDQKQHPGHIGVALGPAYIAKHRSRWQRVPGPAILVFVDDTNDKLAAPAWWVDLRDPASYSTTNTGMILIPKSQRFSHHSKGDFHRLCGACTHDRLLETFSLGRSDILLPILGKTESLRNDAWNYYKAWRNDSTARQNPLLGKILVNRVGWKHITRRGRLPERIVQSWMLLGAAKKLVASSQQVFLLGHAKVTKFADGNLMTVDYLGLRGVISFPYRHQSVVQVVLKRNRLVSPGDAPQEREKIWFYSVYELRRGTLQRV
ncbi:MULTISPECIES: DUF4365 domain-containing protein [Alcaligenes]|uniref:DUF4365 domain-containing protein n=1 Tax=Alcaligenes TaxID=507 RepID=UPI002C3C9312|nr:DUF4365 domain-containing protein [Alcaligenes phenolicus]HRO19003.1 DUF4365 domain-containing protein [Alcaligenes phenolicus]HRP14840.1 DUF4365 domain-containing protein [Alcaligenes phenolicus]